MPTFTIPEEILKESGLSAQDALVELACRLYDLGKLTLWSAARLAGMERSEFEDALLVRGIPAFRVLAADLAEDLDTLAHLKD